MNESVNYLDYANSPLMWAAAALAVAVVFQSILFMKRSIKAASESALTTDQVHKAIKSSVISSIGPSVVIILVTMISPRGYGCAGGVDASLSFIGSVNYEAMAAGFGAQAMERHQTMDTMGFARGVWTMVCGSLLGWLIFTFLPCDKMDKVNHLMSKGNAEDGSPSFPQAPRWGAFSQPGFRQLLLRQRVPPYLHQRTGNRYHSWLCYHRWYW